MDSIYLNINNKLKVLTIFALLSISLVFLTIALAVTTYSVQAPDGALIFLVGIFIGAIILSQWIQAEAKSVSTKIGLYLLDDGIETRMESRLAVIKYAPILIGCISLFSALLKI